MALATTSAVLFSPLCGAAQGGPVSVTINGAPVPFDQPPVEQAGRVYVPLRGVFERLGASVVYARGHINATKSSTTIALSVGKTSALVNGQTQYLDNPPLVLGGRVLVPLRFVSQALGTTVNFIRATQTVAITVPASAHGLPRRTLAETSTGILTQEIPSPDTIAAPKVAEVSAHFAQNVDPKSVRATLDGGDITPNAYVSVRVFAYSITGSLAPGKHAIAINGNLQGGRQFHGTWMFTTIYSQ